ncbi:MAG: HdeA/HdeB family chaperone [Limnobacter sp.]|jgi:hypothetical protein|uniref:HdeA/HdeB family chaperone n=1 Tax=Limnobacter sp. TaxID=2003368 RepID=UPI0022C00DD8|nr:HdeA/HdeB family chaperone [Limnobacter sp.]MCZ8017157.1 HdeA/HdeB family chaperone [Limnobacter sp.]MCZ8081505.1 HdeA/HdeB family chaperone [Paracoccaceae bacterium]
MKKFLITSAMALTAATAHAETSDVSTLTCAELSTLDAETIAIVFFWIDGYVGGQAEDATFDVQRILANMDGTKAICEADPETTVMDAVVQAEAAAE